MKILSSLNVIELIVKPPEAGVFFIGDIITLIFVIDMTIKISHLILYHFDKLYF